VRGPTPDGARTVAVNTYIVLKRPGGRATARNGGASQSFGAQRFISIKMSSLEQLQGRVHNARLRYDLASRLAGSPRAPPWAARQAAFYERLLRAHERALAQKKRRIAELRGRVFGDPYLRQQIGGYVMRR